MTAVNLRRRGVAEAAELVEYCKFPSGTALSDRRRVDGSAVPYGVKLWRLGNEMEGPCQIGHETARDCGPLTGWPASRAVVRRCAG